jgi:hypothetical protein
MGSSFNAEKAYSEAYALGVGLGFRRGCDHRFDRLRE